MGCIYPLGNISFNCVHKPFTNKTIFQDMKSIQDIRRQNINDIINREFDGTQTRLAERLDTQPNLVNRWARGAKTIGDQVARKIEKAARKPENWLDVDHSLAMQNLPVESAEGMPPAPAQPGVKFADYGDLGVLAAENLRSWMRQSAKLNTQRLLSEASGIAQSSINRMLHNEVSITIDTLDALASAFGRQGYELLLHPHDPACISYDRAQYARLPQADKESIENYIKFILSKAQS